MDNKFFKDILPFDGKVDKGSSRKKGYIVDETRPLNVLNVYSDKLQMCIDLELIEEKTNEITAIPEVIKGLDLKNVICTWDALNTQKENIKAVITYEYYQTEKVKWYPELKSWEGLKSIGLVKKTIEKSDGTKVIEKRYYISSLLLDINLFSYVIRAHWNVENKLHWHMDFTFKCDANTTMNKKALYNLQII